MRNNQLRVATLLLSVLPLGLCLPSGARGEDDRAAIYLETARLALNQGRPDVALQKAEQAIGLLGESPEALALAAQSAFQKGDVELAQVFVDRCLKVLSTEFRETPAYQDFMKAAAEIDLARATGVPRRESRPEEPAPRAAAVPLAPRAPAGGPEADSALSSPWEVIIRRVAAHSWVDSIWTLTFRVIPGVDGSPSVLQGAWTWADEMAFQKIKGTCYEDWAVVGDPARDKDDAEVRMTSRGCRFWHRGQAGDISWDQYPRAQGLRLTTRLLFSEDWEEFRFPRPLPRYPPIDIDFEDFERIFEKKSVRVGIRYLYLEGPYVRLEPTAWPE